MTSSFHLLRQEREIIQEMEFDRISQVSFAEIYEKLLNRKIPWEAFSEKKRIVLEPTKESFLYFPSKKGEPIERSFSFTVKKEKTNEEKTVLRVIEVTLFLKHRKREVSFNRCFLVENKL